MANRYTVAILMTAMLSISAFAEDPVPAPAATNKAESAAATPVAAEPVATNTIALIDDTSRDPFWPKGYVPQGKVLPAQVADSATGDSAAVKKKKIEAKWPVLKVGSINKTKDGTYIALIDGIGVIETGNIIKIKKDGYQFSWKIEEIRKAGVKMKQLDVRIAL